MIWVDEHEPSEMCDLLAQAEEIGIGQLNLCGYADYMWYAADGHLVEVERKHWGEVLSDIDGVELQLRGELRRSKELWLYIEDIAVPTPWGIDVYRWESGRFKMIHGYGGRKYPQPGLYSRVESWLWGLDKGGITVCRTLSLEGTAKILVAHYRQGQKDEHTVLNRYLKPKVYVKDLNPLVTTLMGIENAGIGEARAVMLASRFKSVWELANASVKEIAALDGFGPVLARKILHAIGREL